MRYSPYVYCTFQAPVFISHNRSFVAQVCLNLQKNNNHYQLVSLRVLQQAFQIVNEQIYKLKVQVLPV